MVEDSEHAGLPVVRELVHGFLLDLCCSRKHGISFHDVSLGTAGRYVIYRIASLPCISLEISHTNHRIFLI